MAYCLFNKFMSLLHVCITAFVTERDDSRSTAGIWQSPKGEMITLRTLLRASILGPAKTLNPSWNIRRTDWRCRRRTKPSSRRPPSSTSEKSKEFPCTFSPPHVIQHSTAQQRDDAMQCNTIQYNNERNHDTGVHPTKVRDFWLIQSIRNKQQNITYMIWPTYHDMTSGAAPCCCPIAPFAPKSIAVYWCVYLLPVLYFVWRYCIL